MLLKRLGLHVNYMRKGVRAFGGSFARSANSIPVQIEADQVEVEPELDPRDLESISGSQCPSFEGVGADKADAHRMAGERGNPARGVAEIGVEEGKQMLTCGPCEGGLDIFPLGLVDMSAPG